MFSWLMIQPQLQLKILFIDYVDGSYYQNLEPRSSDPVTYI